MTATFDDATIAARTRDAIARVAIKVLDQERPPYRYGTVTAINPDGKTLTVRFADGSEVPVKILGVQPAGVGQVVQVSGRQGDRFVSGVIGQAKPADVSSTELIPPTGLTVFALPQALNAQWNPSSNATKYEIQLSEDALYTVNVRTFTTVSETFTFDNLAEEKDYWIRVRSLNNSDAGSTWLAGGPYRTDAFPRATDGLAPSASPQPIVTSGIGYLYAEWLPVSNPDPVDYEVHVSTVSGFVADATTLVHTVGSTFTFIKTDAAGAPLAYDTTYFVKLIAKDQDGAGPAGAQGSGEIDRVETGDAGRIGVDNITDGLVPASSPDVTGVYNGVGFFMPKWTHIANADPVSYEVHVSTVSGFIPDANTYVGETPSNWFFVRTQGAGAGFATLQHGVTYYVKLWAKDGDGYAAAPGAQMAGTIGKTTADDYTTGSVGGSAIAQLAIGEAHISSAAITTAKIADAAISSAKIANLAVGTAKIADAAIASAKIGDLAVTNAKINDLSASKLTAGTINASVISVINLNASNITAGVLTGIAIRTNLAANGTRINIQDGFGGDEIRWTNSAGTTQALLTGGGGNVGLYAYAGEVYIAPGSGYPTRINSTLQVNGNIKQNTYDQVLDQRNHSHVTGTISFSVSATSGGVATSTSANNGASGGPSVTSTSVRTSLSTLGASAGTSHTHPVQDHSHTLNGHTHTLGNHSHSHNHSHSISHSHSITI